MPVKAQVQLVVYNLGGQIVAQLVNQHQSPGTHSIYWNSRNRLGEIVTNGVCFYQLRIKDTDDIADVVTWKMTLLK